MTGIIITIFVLRYTAIALEHKIKLNKAASALIVLTTIIVVGLIIWYLNYMSPENKRKRKKKQDATAKGYEEKMALSQEESFKKGEAIGRTISTILSKSMKKSSKH